MERERKRRQLKTAGGENKTSFLQTAKLGLMNSGIISLKKGEKPNKIGNSRSLGKPATECMADEHGPRGTGTFWTKSRGEFWPKKYRNDQV